MTRLPFAQIDAFADAPFIGNPAAVMPMAAWLPDDVLRGIAAENNLAETAFMIPCPDPETADWDLRWFTPTVEVALCGHATFASGHLILSRSPGQTEVRFSTRKAGVLTVARDGDHYAMALPAWPAATAVTDVDPVAGALGARPVELWARGSDYLVAVFASAAEVRALKPDFRAILALTGQADVLMIATAPGESGAGAGDPSGADVVSRAFAPGAGIDEDSFTGSAHAVIGPYWAERLGRDSFTAYQASARGGHAGCRIDGDRVILTGRCRTVIEGEFIL